MGIAATLVCADFVPRETPAASCRLVNKVGKLEKGADRFEDPRDKRVTGESGS